MKTNKKGFTITELIIIIVIIGILAAILIPNLTKYIYQAKKNQDTTNLKNISIELVNYATVNGIDLDEITGIDIRSFFIKNNYSLNPQLDDYGFVYNKQTHNIELMDIVDIVPNRSISSDLLEVRSGYYLLSTGKSAIEQALISLCKGNYYPISQLDSEYESYVNMVNTNYPEDKMLYITGEYVMGGSNGINKVILSPGITIIPANNIYKTFDYDEDCVLLNQDIQKYFVGSEYLVEQLGLTNLEEVGSNIEEGNVKVLYNGVDVTDEARYNYHYGFLEPDYYLYDTRNPANKLSIIFLGYYEINGRIILKDELPNIDYQYINANQTNVTKVVSDSYKVFVNVPDDNFTLYKKNIMFICGEEILAYKEIYYAQLND